MPNFLEHTLRDRFPNPADAYHLPGGEIPEGFPFHHGGFLDQWLLFLQVHNGRNCTRDISISQLHYQQHHPVAGHQIPEPRPLNMGLDLSLPKIENLIFVKVQEKCYPYDQQQLPSLHFRFHPGLPDTLDRSLIRDAHA